MAEWCCRVVGCNKVVLKCYSDLKWRQSSQIKCNQVDRVEVLLYDALKMTLSSLKTLGGLKLRMFQCNISVVWRFTQK